MNIYTNASPKDIVRNAFYNNVQGVTEVYIASPFFSYSELVEDLLKSGCLGKGDAHLNGIKGTSILNCRFK